MRTSSERGDVRLSGVGSNANSIPTKLIVLQMATRGGGAAAGGGGASHMEISPANLYRGDAVAYEVWGSIPPEARNTMGLLVLTKDAMRQYLPFIDQTPVMIDFQLHTAGRQPEMYKNGSPTIYRLVHTLVMACKQLGIRPTLTPGMKEAIKAAHLAEHSMNLEPMSISSNFSVPLQNLVTMRSNTLDKDPRVVYLAPVTEVENTLSSLTSLASGDGDFAGGRGAGTGNTGGDPRSSTGVGGTLYHDPTKGKSVLIFDSIAPQIRDAKGFLRESAAPQSESDIRKMETQYHRQRFDYLNSVMKRAAAQGGGGSKNRMHDPAPNAVVWEQQMAGRNFQPGVGLDIRSRRDEELRAAMARQRSVAQQGGGGGMSSLDYI